MSNIVIFGSTQSGKTTLLGYLVTGMLRNPQFNDEVLKNLKLIRNLTIKDEFNIGNPYRPINVNKDVILPSFVSLDKNELKKFTDGYNTSEGTTKRLHHKQLTICMAEKDSNSIYTDQDQNENVSCTFIDVPGFRQRLSDKYRGFFDGEVGIAVLKLSELVKLYDLLNNKPASDTMSNIDDLEGRLFEPIRVWCDYRSPLHLVIAISQIDRRPENGFYAENNEGKSEQKKDINKAIECIKMHVEEYDKGIDIPISPISIRVTIEDNTKPHYRMSVFFRRKAENVYTKSYDLPGTGTLISCLKKVMPLNNENHNKNFSMARVNQVMKAIVAGSPKTALNIHALHGVIHKSNKVIMGPVFDKIYKDVTFVQCEISSIKADGISSPSDMLLEGNAGGVIFKTIRDEKTRTKYNLNFISSASDISIMKSTVLLSGAYIKGDIVELNINKNDYININDFLDEIYSRVLPSIMPFDQLFLFWYGKKVAVNIVEIVFEEDRLKLSVIVSKIDKKSCGIFAVPCDEKNEIKHNDNVLLAIPRVYYSTMPVKLVKDKYTYVSCSIVRLKDSNDVNAVNVKAPNSMCLHALISDNVHIEYEEHKNEFDIINIPLRDERKNIDIYSVLTKVGRSIKKSYNRQGYKDYGGINMMLIEDKAALMNNTEKDV